MAGYSSGCFLRISLVTSENAKRVIEALRGWAKKHNPPVEIWPRLGVSNVIEVSCSDSCGSSVWKETKKEVTRIVRKEARKRNKGGE